MKRMICAALLTAATMGSASADTLNSGQLRALFPGRYVVKVMGVIDVNINAKSNGTVTGTSQGERDTGRWSVEGGKLCIAWKNWRGGKKDCSALSRSGNRVSGKGFWFIATS